MNSRLVIVKGGGDLASGVAHRLYQAGFEILITELPRPLVVRRTVAFATAVRDGSIEIEGVRGRRIDQLDELLPTLARQEIAVAVDPEGALVPAAHPLALVDAIMAKTNLGTHIGDAPVVVALGPGFIAGIDVQAVVETNRGHNLGRVYYQGAAESDTAEPAAVGGYTQERVLKAPANGEFVPRVEIAQAVVPGTIVGAVDGIEIVAQIAGVVRGLIAPGTCVTTGLKIGDIDPGGNAARCYSISDKSRAIAGGVLEAILHLSRPLGRPV